MLGHLSCTLACSREIHLDYLYSHPGTKLDSHIDKVYLIRRTYSTLDHHRTPHRLPRHRTHRQNPYRTPDSLSSRVAPRDRPTTVVIPRARIRASSATTTWSIVDSVGDLALRVENTSLYSDGSTRTATFTIYVTDYADDFVIHIIPEFLSDSALRE